VLTWREGEASVLLLLQRWDDAHRAYSELIDTNTENYRCCEVPDATYANTSGAVADSLSATIVHAARLSVCLFAHRLPVCNADIT
jgi:hypothetical protein